MELKEIISILDLTVVDRSIELDSEVTGGYSSDLLSHVMGQANPGDLWITIQTHQNIVAVASLIGLAGIIIVDGAELDEETIIKAKEEEIPLLTTELSAYEIAGRLYKLGV
ncbi:DRTGG domain-containing protein [Acetohalobium arabaticum]|uniref:HPr kinase n=1 Tax=Acetohalobium arabaticum (strain ATCC 49924 / DSM 5501 / Z-7288) TaxID=574087 RepID=D9QS26_ACEAZ|nr:HPr kinase [Acetohalobium arabaticum DSM 5501]